MITLNFISSMLTILLASLLTLLIQSKSVSQSVAMCEGLSLMPSFSASDQNGPGYILNDGLMVTPDKGENHVEYSFNRDYRVVRQESEKGPDFFVQSLKIHALPTLRPTQVSQGNDCPQQLHGSGEHKEYSIVYNAFPEAFFTRLDPVIQHELFKLYQCKEGFAVADSYFDDWKYKTLIWSRSYTMTFRFDKQGEIKSIRRKTRRGSPHRSCMVNSILIPAESCAIKAYVCGASGKVQKYADKRHPGLSYLEGSSKKGRSALKEMVSGE